MQLGLPDKGRLSKDQFIILVFRLSSLLVIYYYTLSQRILLSMLAIDLLLLGC